METVAKTQYKFNPQDAPGNVLRAPAPPAPSPFAKLFSACFGGSSGKRHARFDEHEEDEDDDGEDAHHHQHDSPD